MSFEENTRWELCGVSYECTSSQANKIMAAVMMTPEWLTYASLKERCNTGDYDATSQAGAKLAEQCVYAYRQAFTKTLEIVERELDNDPQ